MFLVGFPLLLVPFAIYNIVAFLMPGTSWTDAVMRIPVRSGAEWAVSLGDMLVAFSILLLLIEVIKASRAGGRYIVDHGLSILLLLGMGAEFVLIERAATSTFFLLLVTSVVDVVGGLTIGRRRAVAPALPEAPFVDDTPAPTPVHDASTPEALRSEPVRPQTSAPHVFPEAASSAPVIDVLPANREPASPAPAVIIDVPPLPPAADEPKKATPDKE